MKTPFALFLILISGIYGCKLKKQSRQPDELKYATINIQSKPNGDNTSTVTGHIKNLTDGEPIEFARVTFINDDGTTSSSESDLDGNFQLKNLITGNYRIRVSKPGFTTFDQSIKIEQPSAIKLEITIELKQIQVEKPVIYLYPTKKENITVQLNYQGVLDHTYPAYPKTGWKVTAEPNGTLWDEKGQEYYALFWEGKPYTQLIPSDGFIVTGKETAAFLEEKLAYLGLNRREANEFIMYWLPRLENNPFNLIHFAGNAYEEQAELMITPKPETTIRVMMLTQALQSKIDFPVQDLSTLKKIRKGFTAVEWGGSVIQGINF